MKYLSIAKDVLLPVQMHSTIKSLVGDKVTTMNYYLRLAEWHDVLTKILKEYEKENNVKNPYETR